VKIVVDANPLVSMLIKPGDTVDLLFVDEMELVAPALLFVEIERNKEMIVEKSELSREEIDKFILILKARIEIISEEQFILYREKAEQVCPHAKDITYFALALYMNCSIWSNEKKLKEQSNIKVYATHELMRMVSHSF